MRAIFFGMRGHGVFVGLAFAIGAGLLIGASSRAGIITQGAGENWVGFEAEGTGVVTEPTPGSSWQDIADSGASGGHAFQPYSADSGEVAYQIQFSNTATQTYYFYARMRAVTNSPSGDHPNNQALHDAFKVIETLESPTKYMTSYPVEAAGTDYAWATSTYIAFTVPAHFLGTLMMPVKNSGVVVDRIYLSTDNTLTDGNFPAFENSEILVPEPSSVGVALALAGIGLAGRRRLARGR